MATALGIKPETLSRMERGKVKVQRSHIRTYGKIELTDKEQAAIARLFVDNASGHIDCPHCAEHDGEIRPNGREGDRDEYCANIGVCLVLFVKRWGTEPTSHCPKECTKRVRDTQLLKLPAMGRLR